MPNVDRSDVKYCTHILYPASVRNFSGGENLIQARIGTPGHCLAGVLGRRVDTHSNWE